MSDRRIIDKDNPGKFKAIVGDVLWFREAPSVEVLKAISNLLKENDVKQPTHFRLTEELSTKFGELLGVEA